MNFPRVDQDRPRSAFGWPAGFVEEVRDARECIRLEVVGLASEVATQATRIEEVLRRVADAAGPRIAERSRDLATFARNVLDPHSSAHEAGEDVLLDALLALRRDQRTMLKLRREADELARGRPERHTVWSALRAGLGRQGR